MKNGWFGYDECAKPQTSALITVAATRDRRSFSRKGIEKARDMYSSEIPGKNPMKSTAARGKNELSVSSYGISAGAHAPRLSATR